MPEKTKPPPPPRICGARTCSHCRFFDVKANATKPLALTTADLVWYFGEGDAALSAPSTHGAFVDMAMSGIQQGGRKNGVENRAVEPRRLDAVGRHRCVMARLAHVGPATLTVLRAAYGPDDWTRSIGDTDVQNLVERALRGRDVPSCRVLTLTEMAVEHAERRRAQPAAPPKRRPSSKADKTPAERARQHIAEDPGLAGSAVGAVLSAAVAEDKRRLEGMLRAGAELVRAAREAAGVVERQASRRVRSVQLGPKRAAGLPDPYVPEEVLCG